MKKINKYQYVIEQSDKDLAIEKNWATDESKKENVYIGNLAEIAACKYLDIDWNPVEYSVEDLIDNDNIRYQVKSFKDKGYTFRFFLDQNDNWKDGYDRYIFCYIDKDEKHAYIEGDMTADMAHTNSHIHKSFTSLYRKQPC